MKTIQELKLEQEIAEMLEDITDLGNLDDMPRSDYQGILEAKAMQIIKLVRSK